MEPSTTIHRPTAATPAAWSRRVSPPHTLQTIPSDIKVAIVCALGSFDDVRNLRRTCKGFASLIEALPTTIITAVAPRHFAPFWPELLRLTRAKQFMDSVPSKKEGVRIPEKIYVTPECSIIKADLSLLRQAHQFVKSIAQNDNRIPLSIFDVPATSQELYALKRARMRQIATMHNVALLEIIVTGKRLTLRQWGNIVYFESVLEVMGRMTSRLLIMVKDKKCQPFTLQEVIFMAGFIGSKFNILYQSMVKAGGSGYVLRMNDRREQQTRKLLEMLRLIVAAK